MDPFYQSIIIAQYQRELRMESEERRRAARITARGGVRLRASAALIRMGEALAGPAIEASSREPCPAGDTAHVGPRILTARRSVLPVCVRTHGRVTPAGCTPHASVHAHGSSGFHVVGR